MKQKLYLLHVYNVTEDGENNLIFTNNFYNFINNV